jgi:hypothetical protein
MRAALCGILVFMALACADAQSAPQAQPAPQNPDAVVAEIGGRKITMKEVDERWEARDPAERARVTQLIYQNRRNALDQMVGDILIEEAAKAAGLPVNKYLEQENAKRATPVTDDEVRQFYESNQDRTQGRTIDELRPRIRTFLMSQREQQAKAQLVDELKKKSPANVLLEPPRQTVTLAAHDPSIGPPTAAVTIVEFSDYQ